MLIKITSNDNVATALKDIDRGCIVDEFDIFVIGDIKKGHKVALTNIKKGQEIIKYNQTIGRALTNISAGEHVHTHNVYLGDDYSEIDIKHDDNTTLCINNNRHNEHYFYGYLRNDNKVGTRNYVGVMATVNCVSTVVSRIVNSFSDNDTSKYFDGVAALNHAQGCGHILGEVGINILLKVLIGYISHPNFNSLVIIGLGCEDNQMSSLLEKLPKCYRNKVEYLLVSECGGTLNTITKGIEIVGNMINNAKTQRRSKQSISHIKIALQCGGSDSFSGITSNPVLGYASDKVVSFGGVSILSETPEMYGAGNIIFKRIKDRGARKKLKEKFKWWGSYLAQSGASFDSNPSPGNKKGGITTICEKSLGSVAKSGYCDITDVVDYADRIDKKGLIIMDSPGYDPVSVTGQIASGANIICFTTGRGSTIGFKPSPCIKISSNSDLYSLMSDDMDFDCGAVISNRESIDKLGLDLFNLIVEVASGKKTCSEKQFYGNNEFNPWNIDPVV
jgi:altronate dehydratase